MNRRGRPPKENKLVPLVILVPAPVKRYLEWCAEVRQTTLSQEAREVLVHFYETR